MIFTVIRTYNKYILCYNIKYKKHTKYSKVLKINIYKKLKDVRNEFKISDSIFKNHKNNIINKHD